MGVLNRMRCTCLQWTRRALGSKLGTTAGGAQKATARRASTKRSANGSGSCAAVEPATGESFCLMHESTWTGLAFEVFLRKLQEAYPDDQIVLVMDRAGSHQNKSVEWPEDIRPLRLPPRSPELNPAERWFRGLRRRLSNRVFETIEAIEETLTERLRPYWNDKHLLRRLTGYDWWLDGLANIKTLT